MMRMLCRNKLADFAKWKSIFDSHAEDHRRAGLTLEHLWQNHADGNEVFFIFAVADLDRANAFISSDDAKEAGKASGVLEGDYWFVEAA